jgi:endonuclease/exonuclease/phosphatase family metal-dependent hydrolase
VRAALVVSVLAACSTDLGPTGTWSPAETIAPPLSLEAELASGGSTMPLRAGDIARVVSFNVEFGEGPDELAAEILGNAAIRDAAVYLLQEQEAHPDEAESRARSLAGALGLGYVYVPARVKGDGTHGLAIMSRFPIMNVEVMELPRSRVGHRIAVRAEIVIGGRVLPVVNIHLDTKLNIRNRILQLRPAVIDLEPPALVAGDVNTNPYLWEEGAVPLLPIASAVDTDQAPMLDDYMRQLGFATPADDVGHTHRTYGVESRLDAIYTLGLETSRATVERSVGGSDHWPLWIDVALP